MLEPIATIRRPLPITPLIDVVFLLLMFFMLAASFQKEGELQVQSAGSQLEQATDTKPLFIRLHADGSTDVNGQTVPAKELGREAANLISANDKLAGAVVQVRQGTNTQLVVQSLMQLRRARVEPVALAR